MAVGVFVDITLSRGHRFQITYQAHPYLSISRLTEPLMAMPFSVIFEIPIPKKGLA